MELMKIAIKNVKIGPRMRQDLGDIEALAGSMSRVGQLHPIIIDKENNLIAGCRRLAAASDLQWDTIEAVYYEEIDPALAAEIELEENLRRKDFYWTEEVLGLEKLVNLRRDRYGVPTPGPKGLASSDGYRLEDAADELERTSSSISMDLTLARAIREFPEVADEKTKASAFKRYRHIKEIQLRGEQARRTRAPGYLDPPAVTKSFDEWEKERDPNAYVPRQEIKKTVFKDKESALYHADSRDVLRFFADKHITVDCIVTDPPFGLGMHKEGQTISGTRLADNVGSMYDDDPHLIMDMLDEVFMHAAKVLKPDGHAYVFFHMTRYEETYLMLRKHFGKCEETPIVWIKNTPGIGDPNRAWVYGYEPCFFINRGRMLVKAQAFNYLKYDTIPHGQKIHPTEKPAALLRHLITASCVSGEVVLDPFAGSGSTLVAADQVGCKFIGIEKHEGFYRATIDRISERMAEAAPVTADAMV